MFTYLHNIGIVTSQVLNTILGGYPDETLSSRSGKRKLKGKAFPANVIDVLFFWQDEHSISAIEWDEGRTKDKLENMYKLGVNR